jgi:hypothetical protein
MDMFDSRIFHVGDEPFFGRDLLLASIWLGDWPRLAHLVLHGLECRRHAEETGARVPGETVDQAASAFRYARDLVSAVEMEAWLAQAGLTADEWIEGMEREGQRSAWPQLAGAPSGCGFTTGDLRRATIIDGFCTGAFGRLAALLSGRAAVSAGAGGVGALSSESAARVEALTILHAPQLEARGIDGAEGRLAHIAALDAAFEQAAACICTPEELRRRVADNQLDWMELELETLRLPSRSVALEAALCCREEQLSLAAIGHELRLPSECRSQLLEDAPDGLRPVLLSAQPGEILGPFDHDRDHVLMSVRLKTPPTLSSDAVRARAEAMVVGGVVARERQNRVRWAMRF